MAYMVFFLPAIQTPFNELQPDTLNGQVLKYAKTVYQLEKGLPPNAVVPKLKEKVEDMKDKVHTYCMMYSYAPDVQLDPRGVCTSSLFLRIHVQMPMQMCGCTVYS